MQRLFICRLLSEVEELFRSIQICARRPTGSPHKMPALNHVCDI